MGFGVEGYSQRPPAASGPGCTLYIALFAVLLILKGTGTVTWSWWWITCPLWIAPVLMLAGFMFFGAGVVGVASVAMAWGALKQRLRRRRPSGWGR